MLVPSIHTAVKRESYTDLHCCTYRRGYRCHFCKHPGHVFPAKPDLTVNYAVAGLQVAEDADGGDGEHAAQAEDVAAEPVVNTGGALSHPGVVEGREDGERVEADAAEEVHHGQVDAQQLRANHLPPAVVADDQNEPVAQDGQQNWTRRRDTFISGLLSLKG